MTIVDRYLGREVLVATAMAVAVLTLVFGLGHIFKVALPELVEGRLTMGLFLRSIVFILPFSLPFTLPWGLLTAILLVFGRLSADNELISFRMAGYSLLRICTVVLILAIACSSLCYWLISDVSPQARRSMEELIESADPAMIFRPGEVIRDVDGTLIHIGGRDGEEWMNIELVQIDDRENVTPSPLRYLHAKRMAMEKSEGKIVLDLMEVQVDKRQAGAPRSTDPDVNHLGIAQFGSWPLEVPMGSFDPGRLKPDRFTSQELRGKLSGNELDKRHRAEFANDLVRRQSVALASVTFALVGIGLGITAHRRETSVGFVLSLIIALVYFLFIILGGIYSGQEGSTAPLLMWAPNVVFLLFGGWLFWRSSRK